MNNPEVVTGNQRAWAIKEKLGEGDAGEVFKVESLIERKPAIIKRPVHKAFSSDIVRQAAQIAREASILGSLSKHQFPSLPISTPKLLDQSQAGSEFSDRFFMIITQANGLNLAALARAIHFGSIHEDELFGLAPMGLSDFEKSYVDSLLNGGAIPDLVLLRIIDNLLSFLSQLHNLENTNSDNNYSGIIWNDIKADHIFYQPQTALITLIDWGNSHYLESNGVTSDRQFSKIDDFRQFSDEIGRFLQDNAPELFTHLNWPIQDLDPASAEETIDALHQRVKIALKEAVHKLELAHQTERAIIESSASSYEDYTRLQQVQQDLQLLGEIPNFEASRNFAAKIAHELLKNGEIEKFTNLCTTLTEDPSQVSSKWKLLAQISALVPTEPTLRGSLHFALQEDWSSVLWELRQSARYEPTPDWWEELSTLTRDLELDGSSQSITPRTAINRLILSLQSAHQYETPSPTATTVDRKLEDQAEYANRRYQLIQNLKEDSSRRWAELLPNPPFADIGYQEVLRYLPEIMELAPTAGQSLKNSLDQPIANHQIVLDAWERQEFEIARRGLRRMLVWDPDRKRLLTADETILIVPGWLTRLRRGPHTDEALQDFITRYELEGREIKNRIGPASWLDGTLAALRQLRKGGEAAETLVSHPEARPYLSWLLNFESHQPVLSIPGKKLQIERKNNPEPEDPGLRGIHECRIGDGQEIQLQKAMDNWAPEAFGSSARVFLASIKGQQRKQFSVALKIMRPKRVDYALPLFREEVQILSLLRDIPGVARMLEFGFLNIDPEKALLLEEDQLSHTNYNGQCIRYGLDSTHNFLIDLEKNAKLGLLPYLAIEAQEQRKNLLALCDTGYTHGHFLPVLEGILLSIQICDILEAAHSRHISYRDHKILHYYWDENANGVTMIDWNIAKRHPAGMTTDEARFDLVQFGARALHHILTGRTAAGALPLGPTRPEEIENAATSYQVKWTFDDQRLPKAIKDILEKTMAGYYEKPKNLREDLYLAFQQLSEIAQTEDPEQPAKTSDILGKDRE